MKIISVSFYGAEDGDRTHDLRVTSALLYHLSYLGNGSSVPVIQCTSVIVELCTNNNIDFNGILMHFSTGTLPVFHTSVERFLAFR